MTNTRGDGPAEKGGSAAGDQAAAKLPIACQRSGPGGGPSHADAAAVPRASGTERECGQRPARARSGVWSELLRALATAEGRTRNLSGDDFAALVRRRGEETARAVLAARERTRARRARVLAHPDLAGRVQATLGLTEPSRWNGYVPPSTDCRGYPNTSPYRAALVEISAEALRRERQCEAVA